MTTCDKTKQAIQTAGESSSNEHRHVRAMLPWIANDSATLEQRARATKHMERCEDCRTELVAQHQLRRTLLAQTPAVFVDPEEGLQRLLGRLAPPLQKQPMPIAPPKRKRNSLLVAMAAAIAVQALGFGVLSIQHLLDRVDGRVWLHSGVLRPRDRGNR